MVEGSRPLANMALFALLLLTFFSSSCLSFRFSKNSGSVAPFHAATPNFMVSNPIRNPTSVTQSTRANVGNSASSRVSTPKNLKTAGGVVNEISDTQGALFSVETWNELKGLSEKELLVSYNRNNANILNNVRQDRALSLAYRRCEHVTQLFSKTFYMGTTLMKEDARAHVWAIYTWCRRTDDIVDSPRALLDRDVLSSDLAKWNDRLDHIWNDNPHDLFDLALSDTVKKYPTLPILPFRDMIDGMVMDVPGLGQDRYNNFEELYLYCYRVAGTVGLMTLPILGTAKGYTEKEAAEPAIALGIGFQLTNILRDVGEDLERGRIYLPLDELKQFGLSEEDLFRCEVTPKYVKFMQFQIQRARDYYDIAKKGIKMLAPEGRFAVQASLDLYSRILNVIERNGYDNFRKRAFTTKLEKLSILPNALISSIRA